MAVTFGVAVRENAVCPEAAEKTKGPTSTLAALETKRGKEKAARRGCLRRAKRVKKRNHCRTKENGKGENGALRLFFVP